MSLQHAALRAATSKCQEGESVFAFRTVSTWCCPDRVGHVQQMWQKGTNKIWNKSGNLSPACLYLVVWKRDPYLLELKLALEVPDAPISQPASVRNQKAEKATQHVDILGARGASVPPTPNIISWTSSDFPRFGSGKCVQALRR